MRRRRGEIVRMWSIARERERQAGRRIERDGSRARARARVRAKARARARVRVRARRIG